MPVLLILMVIKFFMVVSVFMHLVRQQDLQPVVLLGLDPGRLVVYIVALFTFQFFDSGV